MNEDVFRFDDFLKEKNESKIDTKDIRKMFEDSEEENSLSVGSESHTDQSQEDEEYDEFKKRNPYAPSKEDMDELMSAHDDDEFEKESEETEEEVEKEIEIKESNENYYKLYSDKSEDFICDISIEGANLNETEARIVVESEDWTLMFSGEIKNGKCIVPIKKLNILKEGQVGNIRLEVIAEGNMFIPWEDKFKVKLSKKVTVKLNEQKEQPKKSVKKQSTVKVRVNK